MGRFALCVQVRSAETVLIACALCFAAQTEGRLSNATSKSDIGAFREAALECPLPRAVELIGEKWAFLILRGAFNQLRHFEEFQGGLGIARNILSDRLAKLVAGGILKRSADPSDKRKVIYELTDKGRALLPVVVALRQWGEDWGHGPADVVLADRRDGRAIRKICVQAQDGRELELSDLVWTKRTDSPVSQAAE
jgi:DNA-binding HxlR family transcriptional regulator